MARLTHVLVIDSDPDGLRTVCFGFEREGCRVTAADSTDSALASLQSARPDAVVLALRQGVDASRFILEDLAHGQDLPVVAMGSEEHRRAVVQNRAEFLAIPAYLRDIITATKLRAAVRSGGPGHDGLVQGALSEFGLFFLLRTFLSLKSSGVVQLERANRRGELKFSKGELRSAQLGTITGAPALNQLLLWEEAAMEIRFKAVNGRSQFNNKGADLVEEAERFLRDFAHSARNLGSAQTVYEVVPGAEQDVQLEMAPVLRLFDGVRSVGDVLDESPFRVFDTLRIISRFVDTETVRKKQGVEARPAVSTSAASPLMDAWLKGEVEVVAPAAVASQSRGGKTGPLPVPATAQAPVPEHAPLPAHASTNVAASLPEAHAPQQAGSPRSTRGELVSRATPGAGKSVGPRPSMVIDLPPELLDAAAKSADGPEAHDASSESSHAPGVQQNGQAGAFAPRGANHPRGNGSSPASLTQASPEPVGPGAIPRTTGSLEIRTAPRQTKVTPRPTGSIELDPALMAELESAHSNGPRTPAPVQAASPPAAAAPPGPTQPALRTPPPAQAIAVGSGRAVAAGVTAKTRTGEFDQLEKDFFAREKDLYAEGPDSFDDLE